MNQRLRRSRRTALERGKPDLAKGFQEVFYSFLSFLSILFLIGLVVLDSCETAAEAAAGRLPVRIVKLSADDHCVLYRSPFHSSAD